MELNVNIGSKVEVSMVMEVVSAELTSDGWKVVGKVNMDESGKKYLYCIAPLVCCEVLK